MENKEREAYRMRCKHYSDVSGHCHKQSGELGRKLTVVQTKEDIELNNDKEMKLKDLLKGRDKLRKYEELERWRDFIKKNSVITSVYVPDNIRKIILNALDAELKKMEKE